MRISQLVTSMLLVPLAAAAQQKVDIGRPALPTVSVRIGGALASLHIFGWDRDSISIVGTLGPGSRIDGGPTSSAGPVSGMKFYLEAPDESSLRDNRIQLRVPRNARVWIKAGSAEIEATGVRGGLDLNIVGGSVRVNSSPRELLVEAMDGGITLAGSPEYARLKTATGDISVTGGGSDVSLASVSGAIRVGEGTFERGRFESVTGPITFAGDFRPGGELRFDTHSGAIELRLPRKTNLEIDAATMMGGIENTWSMARPIAGREGRGMELGTSSGIGGARVIVRSFKGNVRLAGR